MGLLTRLLWPDRVERRMTDGQLIELLTAGQPSAAGVAVTPESSLQYASVLACVRVLAEAVAQLPLILYEREERGRRRALEHPLYTLLHVSPNGGMTSFEWRELIMAHLTLWGNAFGEIERDGAGRPVAIWPLMPWAMTVQRAPDGSRWYEYQLDSGQRIIMRQDQILHVPGFSYDGLQGGSIARLARGAIGLGKAAEVYGSAFFSNGARPSVVLEHPGVLSDESYRRLKESWRSEHEGLSNAQRMAVLEEGMRLQSYGIPPEEAQFLETRRYQRTEIAAVFRVPPHMIGDLERATFSNIEQQSLDFVLNSLQPWLVRIEQRLNTSLLSRSEQARYYSEHLVAGLLRGDMAARYQSYAIARQWGWLSVNDIRELENMNPIDDGDVYLQPLNMIPAGSTPAGLVEEEPGSGQDQREARALIERRQSSAASRQRLASSYTPTFVHTAQRIVNREVNDLRNAQRRYKGQRAEFDGWLQPWLEAHTEVVREYTEPVMSTYGDAITAEVEREVERESSAEAMEAWTGDYISSRADVWLARLRRGISQSLDEPEEDEDPWDKLDQYLTRRKDEQAERWSREELVRMGNAVARVAYASIGVLRLIWMAFGSESCPYCTSLDGTTVGIEENFLSADSELAPEGHQAFVSSSDIGHPPLHEGCQCVIMSA